MTLSALIVTALAALAVLPAAALRTRDEWQVPAVCLYVTSDTNWEGNSHHYCGDPGTCVDMAPEFNISSAGPEYGYTCVLYDTHDCSGASYDPISWPGSDDLGSAGFKTGRSAQSFKCYVWAGYTPASSSSTSALSTTTTTVTSTGTVAGTTISTTLSSFLTTSSSLPSSGTGPVPISTTSLAAS
ncbi:hypothetical protein Tdes44962_MAKER04160 [Teratosphaeria destructans]|uniref:Small secreted protein n=1 Tax=Teratosphaeria destructans TaxID=418781 RepID=A0A9W7W0P0_9PEZI|nr:hypothetical protein Tdes44962_MAKER04160 [Teratosphaeria destructans]